MEFITSLDFKVLFLIQKIRNPILDYLMVFLSALNNFGLICLISGIILMFKRKFRPYGVLIIVATLSTAFVGNIMIKNLFERARPFYSSNIDLIINTPSGFSFPSGHTSTAFTCAGILSILNKKLTIVSFTVASLIGFSRMYLFVHFPSDVICGALLGIIMSKLFIYLYKNRFSPTHIKNNQSQ